jgi:uncharacterized protein (TIRG00374 family)
MADGDDPAAGEGGSSTAADPGDAGRPAAGGGTVLEGLFSRELLAKTGAGAAVALVLVYLLGWYVGWQEVLDTLSGADLWWVAVGCASTALCLAAWGKAWQVVLSVVGVGESYRKLVVTYFAATFANYVTPLGQAGGEPFIAYVLSRDTEASYQDSLASVVTADLLNLLPFFNFAAVGLAYLLWQAELPAGAESLAQGLALLALGVPVLVVVGWRYRDAVEGAVLAVVAPVAAHTARISVAGVRDRIDEFYVALERITDSPRSLAYALVFSYVGWVLFALPLYFSGLALGYEIDPLVVLFVVPASTLAGLVPTPGGLGGVESALTALVVALTTLGAAEAFALAVVYRVASFWFSILVGGVAALWVTARV